MKSADYKMTFGVSKTAYRNMVKQGIAVPVKVIVSQDGTKHLSGSTGPSFEAIEQWKEIKKKRKQKIRVVQKRNYEDSKLVRRSSKKIRKRKDGKAKGSVDRGYSKPQF